MAQAETVEAKSLLERATFEWQPLEPWLADMVELIPSGRALRKYQLNKTHADKHRTGVGPERPLSESAQIRSGARSIANGCLKGFIDRGRIEVCEIEGQRHFRFVERRVAPTKPCANCGHAENPTQPKSVNRQQLISETQQLLNSILY